ncbi:MAG TPA: cytochrome c [Bacteroidota bacterium]|nr:cytochrome c [Bacteroidota bacterium]
MSSLTELKSVLRGVRPLCAAVACIAAAAVAGGCHLDMYDQPKFKPLAADPFYADGASARPLVEGTVARGHADTNEYRSTGKSAGKLGSGFPFPVTMPILLRGRDRFDTFCSPCHGRLADGNGMVVRRGFPRPPSLLADSIRSEPEGFFFDVVTEGFGRMYSYAPSIPPDDRWAVVAYLRALQLRSSVPVAELPPGDRARLEGAPR